MESSGNGGRRQMSSGAREEYVDKNKFECPKVRLRFPISSYQNFNMIPSTELSISLILLPYLNERLDEHERALSGEGK